MSPGIPSSPDRRDRQVRMIAVTVLLLGGFFLLLYLSVTRDFGAGGDAAPGANGTDRLRAYLEEEERASAYAALRLHMDGMIGQPGIEGVFCRDSRHRRVGDTMEFRGDVDFQRPSGELERHTYLAILRGSKAEGWEVRSVETTPDTP